MKARLCVCNSAPKPSCFSEGKNLILPFGGNQVVFKFWQLGEGNSQLFLVSWLTGGAE